jgi:uncharacterized protein YxjI
MVFFIFFDIQGDFFARVFDITEVGSRRFVAKINRNLSLRSFMTGMEKYVVTIEPGFDCALIVEFVIAIDQYYTVK